MNSNIFVIRASCSIEYGTGHLHRSIALAIELTGRKRKVKIYTDNNELAKTIGGRFGFVCYINAQTLIPKSCYKQINSIALLLIDIHISLMHEDSPLFSQLKNIKSISQGHSIPLLAIGHINQNDKGYQAIIDIYPTDRHERKDYFSGPQYAVLHRDYSERKCLKSTKKGILVAFGGTDPFNLTLKVCSDLMEGAKSKVHITIILGKGYAHLPRLQEMIRKTEFVEHSTILRGVESLKDHIANSLIGIVGFGTTAFEFLSQGTPCLIFSHYKSQDSSALYFCDLSGCEYLGCAETLVQNDDISNSVTKFIANKALLQHISETGINLVDGNGTNRVTDILEEFAKSNLNN